MVKASHEEINKELIAITLKLLADSGETRKKDIKLHDSLQRRLGIDSLGRAELFQRVEKSFAVNIPDKLLASAETLSDIADYLYQAEPQIKQPIAHDIITSHGEKSSVDPTTANSLTDILFLYGNASAKKAHIYFQTEDGQEEVITYGQLLEQSLRLAAGLKERGLGEGETVAIMQPTNPGFFYSFLGTLLAGGVPVPIYPPFRMHMLEAYAKTEARILRNAEVRILITFDQAETLSRLLQTFVPSLKSVTTVAELLQAKPLATPFQAKADNYAFIQYTSGSTADPKGVLLTHANLLANIRAYLKAVNVTSDDVAVSWLPLYHDMGLIGMWLGSMYSGVPLVLLTPFSFLNHPQRWLWAIHHHRGTITGAPNFAYELCVRKIDPATIEGLDLSSLRVAANGAEKIYPRTLEQFTNKFAPYGLKRTAILPVYGLAESTVGLAIPPMNREFKLDKVDRKQFEEQRHAVPSKEEDALTYVACGHPIEGHEIRIVDDKGGVLPERRVGGLQFKGPSSMQGYYNNPKATAAIFHDGWFDSGDLAYQADGEVFITGRRKDLIIKAGRNLYPAEIEELIGNIDGIRQGCVAVFGVTETERATEELVVVAETREQDKSKREEIINNIKAEMADTLDVIPDHVVLVAPHTVPKTSSGKLQRAACKKMYLENHLDRKRLPASLQVAKLALKGFEQKCINGLRKIGNFIYTIYIGIIIAITLPPLYLLVRFSSRETSGKLCRAWARLLLRLSFNPVKVIGLEKLADAPIIYTANHASYIDAIVSMAFLPANTRFIGKKELLSVPIIRTFIRKLDYLTVDRWDMPKGIEDTKQIEKVLKSGAPIMIFPEGTFGYASGLRPFRLGAFKVAAETNAAVCPIALQGTRFILRNSDRLLHLGRVIVTICDPIKPLGTEWQDVTQLRNAVRAQIAKYCGEPSLDYITAQTVAPKPTHD